MTAATGSGPYRWGKRIDAVVLRIPRLPAHLVAQARRVDDEDEQVLAAGEQALGREGDLVGTRQVDEPGGDEGGVDHGAGVERHPPLRRADEVHERLGRLGHVALVT